MGRRMSGGASLAEWFHADRDQELNEEAIGLGEYGRTLTVLWSDSLSDHDELRSVEEDPDGGDPKGLSS